MQEAEARNDPTRSHNKYFILDYSVQWEGFLLCKRGKKYEKHEAAELLHTIQKVV